MRGEQVNSQARFFTSDHLGSVRDVTEISGTSLARYAFDPWGQRTVTAGSDVTTVGFTGHRTHTSAGLALSLYRAYEPASARWISEDPDGLRAGPNLFAYVDNTPTTAWDPLGLQRRPPPLSLPPAGCKAGTWQFARYEQTSQERGKWSKVREWIPEFVGMNGSGVPDSAAIGGCICPWARVRTIRVTTQLETWKRQVTCCDGKRTEYASTQRKIEEEIPSVHAWPLRASSITIGVVTGDGCVCQAPNH